MRIVYTKHAKDMLKLRKLPKTKVKACLKNPDVVVQARQNKQAYLKDFGNNYLKVIAVPELNKLIVITLYWLERKRIR